MKKRVAEISLPRVLFLLVTWSISAPAPLGRSGSSLVARPDRVLQSAAPGQRSHRIAPGSRCRRYCRWFPSHHGRTARGAFPDPPAAPPSPLPARSSSCPSPPPVRSADGWCDSRCFVLLLGKLPPERQGESSPRLLRRLPGIKLGGVFQELTSASAVGRLHRAVDDLQRGRIQPGWDALSLLKLRNLIFTHNLPPFLVLTTLGDHPGKRSTTARHFFLIFLATDHFVPQNGPITAT